jgi:hypothetical protein
LSSLLMISKVYCKKSKTHLNWFKILEILELLKSLKVTYIKWPHMLLCVIGYRSRDIISQWNCWICNVNPEETISVELPSFLIFRNIFQNFHLRNSFERFISPTLCSICPLKIASRDQSYKTLLSAIIFICVLSWSFHKIVLLQKKCTLHNSV